MPYLEVMFGGYSGFSALIVLVLSVGRLEPRTPAGKACTPANCVFSLASSVFSNNLKLELFGSPRAGRTVKFSFFFFFYSSKQRETRKMLNVPEFQNKN